MLKFLRWIGYLYAVRPNSTASPADHFHTPDANPAARPGACSCAGILHPPTLNRRDPGRGHKVRWRWRADRRQATEKLKIFLYNRAFGITGWSLALPALQFLRMRPLGPSISRLRARARVGAVLDQARSARDQHFMTESQVQAALFNQHVARLATAAQPISRQELGRGSQGLNTSELAARSTDGFAHTHRPVTISRVSESNPQPDRRAGRHPDRHPDHHTRRVSIRLAKSGMFRSFRDFAGLAEPAGQEPVRPGSHT